MQRLALLAVGAALLATGAPAQVVPFPADFQTRTVATNGARLHVRVGGHGPAVVLLHGFGESGDMWAPLAKALAADHTVIVPDLRGMGLSDHPTGGYDKATEARDVAGGRPTSWVQLICELQRDWNRDATVPGFADILFAIEGH